MSAEVLVLCRETRLLFFSAENKTLWMKGARGAPVPEEQTRVFGRGGGKRSSTLSLLFPTKHTSAFFLMPAPHSTTATMPYAAAVTTMWGLFVQLCLLISAQIIALLAVLVNFVGDFFLPELALDNQQTTTPINDDDDIFNRDLVPGGRARLLIKQLLSTIPSSQPLADRRRPQRQRTFVLPPRASSSFKTVFPPAFDATLPSSTLRKPVTHAVATPQATTAPACAVTLTPTPPTVNRKRRGDDLVGDLDVAMRKTKQLRLFEIIDVCGPKRRDDTLDCDPAVDVPLENVERLRSALERLSLTRSAPLAIVSKQSMHQLCARFGQLDIGAAASVQPQPQPEPMDLDDQVFCEFMDVCTPELRDEILKCDPAAEVPLETMARVQLAFEQLSLTRNAPLKKVSERTMHQLCARFQELEI